MEELQAENKRLKEENELLKYELNFYRYAPIDWDRAVYIPELKNITRQNFKVAKKIYALHPSIIDFNGFPDIYDCDMMDDFFKTFMDTIINESDSVFDNEIDMNMFCSFLYNQYGMEISKYIKQSHYRYARNKKEKYGRNSYFCGSAIDEHYFDKTLPELLKKYYKKFRDMFNSVMHQSKIRYWDENIISIIQPYLCLPYLYKSIGAWDFY